MYNKYMEIDKKIKVMANTFGILIVLDLLLTLFALNMFTGVEELNQLIHWAVEQTGFSLNSVLILVMIISLLVLMAMTYVLLDVRKKWLKVVFLVYLWIGVVSRGLVVIWNILVVSGLLLGIL